MHPELVYSIYLLYRQHPITCWLQQQNQHHTGRSWCCAEAAGVEFPAAMLGSACVRLLILTIMPSRCIPAVVPAQYAVPWHNTPPSIHLVRWKALQSHTSATNHRPPCASIALTGQVSLALLDDDQVQGGQVGGDDAAADRLPAALTLPAAVAPEALLATAHEQAHATVGQHTLQAGRAGRGWSAGAGRCGTQGRALREAAACCLSSC